ncbi:uncharacterized protein [Typha latifolia]|uniref:uncharacterized protein n=1 Tax=Typha latifolia TaxID=4733 RepID=UPI003C2EFE69
METGSHSDPLDDALAGRRWCFFCIPWSSSRRRPEAPSLDAEWWDRMRASERSGDERRSPWWSRGLRALMKVREWSELVAGPRWKTFIRRFNRNPRHHGGAGAGSARFQYDPLSYALNFDEGHGASPEGDYVGYRDFSARFAGPPLTANSSMDLGGRDAPPLFVAGGVQV